MPAGSGAIKAGKEKWAKPGLTSPKRTWGQSKKNFNAERVLATMSTKKMEIGGFFFIQQEGS